MLMYVYSRQVVYSPEDPAHPCVEYPTQRFRSYAECDEDFVRRSLPSGLGMEMTFHLKMFMVLFSSILECGKP